MSALPRIITLSEQLLRAVEADQAELVGTLLVERQQLLKTLSPLLPDDERAQLLEADRALREAMQQLKDQTEQELEGLQRRQVTQRFHLAAYATPPPASFLDQLR